MKKEKMKNLILEMLQNDGMVETGVPGVKFFKVSKPIRCSPAVYKPAIIAILNGSKEAIVDGTTYNYDQNDYMCCTITMPVEAGTPKSSNDNPLIGVYISLDTDIMTKLTMQLENSSGTIRRMAKKQVIEGLTVNTWDNDFTDALLRLIEIVNQPIDKLILGESRLREVYYAVLKGDAGTSIMKSFGIGNEISRAIQYLSNNLEKKISIDEMASEVGMSRASFHRKFKQATTMSPVQFVKSIRLNSAAMYMAAGKNVNETAFDVGYSSPSQFSREFKRMYGLSPKQWLKTVKHNPNIGDQANFFDQI